MTSQNTNKFEQNYFLYERIFAGLSYAVSSIFFIRAMIGFKLPKKEVFQLANSVNDSNFNFLYELSSLNIEAVKDALISFAIFIVTQYLTNESRNWRIQNQFALTKNEIIESISKSFSIQYVGTSSEVSEMVRASARKASYVQNTFLRMGGFSRYSEVREAEVIGCYEEFLNKGPSVVWEDIVSVNEVHEFRHRRIFMKKNKNSGKHIINVLRSNMPIINFVILKDERTRFGELYFGWIDDKSNRESLIYRTNDEGLISVFDRNFQAMKDAKPGEQWAVDYSMACDERGPHGNFSVDKRGIWITTLFDANNDPVNFGFINIDFHNGQALIKGKIFKEDSFYNIEHRDTTRSNDRLYFAYSQPGLGNKNVGLCVYTFIRRDGKDWIDGYLFEDGVGKSGRIIGSRALGISPESDISIDKIKETIKNYREENEKYDLF